MHGGDHPWTEGKVVARHELCFKEVGPWRERDVLLRPVCHGDDRAIVQEVDVALIVADRRGGARRNDGAARELEDHVQGGPGDHLAGGRRQDLNRGGGRRSLRLRLRAAAAACRRHDDKHDSKGDVIAETIGTGGGTLIGTVFSHVARGFGIGLIGSTVYILSRKGNEVNLPAQTMITVRMDNTVTLPRITADNGALSQGRADAQ